MTYQICLQSIIQCVEYEFAVVKFVEQDCQKQKDICVILWMYITTPPLPPPPLSTTDIGLTTALISEEQPSLYKFKEMAILASEAFCTHLIFCNISISFQTNSCWHQKWLCAIDCQMPAQISSIPGRIYQFVTSPRLIVVVNQPLTDGRGIISIFQHTSGKTAAKKTLRASNVASYILLHSFPLVWLYSQKVSFCCIS